MQTGLQSQRILLIDDNHDCADAMAELLECTGYETQKAYDGIEAISIASWFSPQVIISDLSMPNMNGLAVSRALRRMPNVCNAAIIILTGFWGETAEVAKESGVDFVLLKPSSFQDTLTCIHSAIELRRSITSSKGAGAIFKR